MRTRYKILIGLGIGGGVLVGLCVISIVALLILRFALFEPFQMSGNGMMPAIAHNEFIFVARRSYTHDDPQRGDIVVYYPRGDSRKFFVQRIIGLPGETLILRNGDVFIDAGEGENRIVESYLDDQNQGATYSAPTGEYDRAGTYYSIPEEHYFLMGDNRRNSYDSRAFSRDGFVHLDDLFGRVQGVILPLSAMRGIERMTYSFDVSESI